MNIGLYNIDSKEPNYALMKISAHYKLSGHTVEFCKPIMFPKYNKMYASSIFTYSRKDYINDDIICGGTGFDIYSKLPKEIDDLEPDYSLYPDFKQALGFLTRGCIRKCPDCIVPEKEGMITPYRDIQQIAQDRREVILFDNNVLACEFGIKQIEKIVKLSLKVDFNQGLDARLITPGIAKLLSKVKWLKPIRLACDNLSMIKPVERAVRWLRWFDAVPRQYTVYVMAKEMRSTVKIIRHLKGLDVDPFVQPFRNLKGEYECDSGLRELSRWVNMKQYFRKISYAEFKRYRKTNKTIPKRR